MTRNAHVRIELAGEPVALLADKALYWPRERTLFVADFHLGKAAAFRDAGVPLPGGTTTRLVDRLARSVEETGASTVVFLGDFLHSKAGRAPRTLERFAAWRSACRGLRLRLVRGNHDAHAGDPPDEWGFECIEEGEVAGPFVLAHHPGALAGGYALSGHIHPAVHIAERAGPGMRLPCFWLAQHHAVLPAFGEFTGTAVVEPGADDRVFVVADDEVIELRRPR